MIFDNCLAKALLKKCIIFQHGRYTREFTIVPVKIFFFIN